MLKYFFVSSSFQMSEATQDGYFTSFISSVFQPLLLMTLFAAFCIYVVWRGVEKGIEKYSRVIMPALIIMVVFICGYSLCISHTDANGVTRTGMQGAGVYFWPNFEGMTLKRFLTIALDAIGQLFYSLSIAMGIMIAYGSYMKKSVNLGQAIDRIEIFDTVIALLAGLMIIPAVYVFMGTEGMKAGPGLMFIALPKVFAHMGTTGSAISFVFFLMVTFAAITRAVSILEAIVSSVMVEHRRDHRHGGFHADARAAGGLHAGSAPDAALGVNMEGRLRCVGFKQRAGCLDNDNRDRIPVNLASDRIRKRLSIKCINNIGILNADSVVAELVQVDSRNGLAFERLACCGMVLVSGHTGGGIVKDQNGSGGLIVEHVHQ